MENISELKQHLHAIEQTRQISNAMYLLSTSRMKKSMQSIDYNLDYMHKLRATIKDIISKTKHNMLTDPFIELTEGGKALFFVITSDKGLCGGYNSAVFNLAMKKMSGYDKPVVYSYGYKGTEMFLNHGITPDDSMYGASQRPSLYSARALGERIVELYDDCAVSEVYIVYTEYVNSAVQRPVCKRVLPLLRRDFDDVEYENKYLADVLYEPDLQTVFDRMVPQYIIGMMYDIMMQSAASENAARMTAMQNATKNADEMIADLSRKINAARQLIITNEITEITAATNIKSAE